MAGLTMLFLGDCGRTLEFGAGKAIEYLTLSCSVRAWKIRVLREKQRMEAQVVKIQREV